jgi:hypothetical protein
MKLLRRICDTEFETWDGRRLIRTAGHEWWLCDRSAVVIAGPFHAASDAYAASR